MKVRSKTLFYGWIIMVASLVMGIIGFGIRYSFGIFFNSLESEFQLSRAATAGIYSTYMLLGGGLAILGGWALDKWGPRKISLVMSFFVGLSLLTSSQVHTTWQIYLTYGVLQALGTGAMFAVVSSTATRWFVKRRGLVIGITGSSGAVGQIVLVPFASLLLLNFDWRVAFVVLGVLVWLVLFPVSLLMKRDPREIGLLPDGVVAAPPDAPSSRLRTFSIQSGLLLSEALKVREFWFLGLSWLLSGFSSQLVLTHIVPHAIELGISVVDATFIISLIGAGAILGRVIDGKLSDSIGRKVPAIFGALTQAVALILLIFVHQVWLFYLVGLLFGYGWGGLNTEIVLLIGDVFGLRSIGAIIGASVAGYNFGSAIGPAVGGVLFDLSGSYAAAFSLAALGMLIAAFLCIVTRPAPAQKQAPA